MGKKRRLYCSICVCVLLTAARLTSIDQTYVVPRPGRRVLPDSCSALADAFHINVAFIGFERCKSSPFTAIWGFQSRQRERAGLGRAKSLSTHIANSHKHVYFIKSSVDCVWVLTCAADVWKYADIWMRKSFIFGI